MPTSNKRNLNDWIMAARQTVELPDGTATAIACMECAEGLATTPEEFTQVAAGWLQCLGNQEAAIHCMEKAEVFAGASGQDEICDYIALATAYEHDLNEPARAEIWRQQVAEAAGRYGTNAWLHAAKTARKIRVENRQLALQYMAQAEVSAKDHRDCIATAETWKRTFRNKKGGERCLWKSQEHAASSQDWLEIADIWLREFKNETVGAQCLIKAAKSAESPLEMCSTARRWLNHLPHHHEGQRCLKQAEEMAATTRHRLAIAKIWHRELRDVTGSEHCLEAAEQAANSASDWGEVASHWKTVHGDEANANRCYGIGYGEVRSMETMQTQFDAVESWLIDGKTRDRNGITRTGYLEKSKSYPGTWNTQKSDRRPECLSRLYSFTIATAAEVGIMLLARVPPYLYLTAGEVTDGLSVYEGEAQPYTKHRMWTYAAATYGRLPAGTYTVEATTEHPCDETSFLLGFTLGN